MTKAIGIIIFLLGYVAIALEHFTRVSKTAVSLLLAIALWLLAVASGTSRISESLFQTGSEVFELVIFLLSAMTLVEILTHYGFFDVIYTKLVRLKLKDMGQFFVITSLAFFFSSFLNNLTTTIVFLQIASRFFRGKNLLRAGAAIVIAANAGGTFSPIGDVTTTMLWLTDKFTTSQIVTQGFLPSLAVFLVSVLLIGRNLTSDTKDVIEKSTHVGKAEWLVITICLASFGLPLVMTFVHLPPYFGLLLGLGIVWLVVDILKQQGAQRTALSVSIEKFFQQTDIGSLYFFVGILIAISSLAHLGALEDISRAIFAKIPTRESIIAGNIAIGALSAIFDNIPLTAAALNIVKTTDPSLWVLLALSVGVGGSIFVIGSAPGIIAMTVIKDLTFQAYFKIATLPALLAYGAGIAVWLVQRRLWA